MNNNIKFNFIDNKRGFIEIQGEDAIPFLNGLITNDVGQLNSTQSLLYTLMLNPAGKYDCDFFIFKFNDRFVIDCLKSQCTILMQKFRIYKLRSRVNVQDISDQWLVSIQSQCTNQVLCAQDPRHQQLGYRDYYAITSGSLTITSPSVTLPDLNSGDPIDFQERYNKHRITLGIPTYPASLIPNKTIPLEANMDELNAIDWHKGCYLGQELTARTKYRGLIHKRYLPVRLDHGTPEIGWEITYQDEKIGTLLEFDQTVGIARLAIDKTLQIIRRGHTIQQKYCSLIPVVPDWLVLY